MIPTINGSDELPKNSEIVPELDSDSALLPASAQQEAVTEDVVTASTMALASYSSPVTFSVRQQMVSPAFSTQELLERKDMAKAFDVSKIFIPAALGAISWAAGDEEESNGTLVVPIAVCILWISIILMVVGFYLRPKSPTRSVTLGRWGHLICIAGIILLQTPVIIPISPSLQWIPTFLVATVVGGAMFFAGLI